MKEINYINIFKALSDTNRLEILKMISENEKCACKILQNFNISQPTLSHHMKILCDSGIVKSRKEGKWSFYSIDRETLEYFQSFINSL